MQGSIAGRQTLRAPVRAALAVLTLTVAAPLAAAEVYVPALNPAVANDGSRSETELWISNAATAQAAFATNFLGADSDGTQRSTPPTSRSVAAGQSFNVTRVGQSGKVGLVAIELASGLVADARIVSTSQSGTVTTTRVPVISDANKIAAGAKAEVLGLERDPERGRLLHFGVVNVARQAATCKVGFFRADGSQVASTVTLALKPLSLLHFQDAFAILGEFRISGGRAEVTCDQPFYAYGAQFFYPASHYLFLTPAGAVGGGGTTNPPPQTGTSVVFERAGLVHAATVSVPKGRVDVAVASALSLKRLILDMDVVPGPWNREKTPGNHAIVWLYRGKFRSNTVANINAFGPNKYTVKASQNVDLAAAQLTVDEAGITFVQGQKYHVHYVYDAENGLITMELSSGGEVLRTLSFAATATNHALTVPATGMIAEFGHYYGQEGPEVASPGWAYYDLRIEMVKY
jgi:hypothetical protein